MRSWMALSVLLARVVTIVPVSSSSPFGPVQVSHRPAKASGSPDAACHVERPLAVARFLPFVEAVGRNEATLPFHAAR